MKIYHYKEVLEAVACKAFLDWRGIEAEIIEDVSILKETGWIYGVIVKDDSGKFVANGIRDLVSNWRYCS